MLTIPQNTPNMQIMRPETIGEIPNFSCIISNNPMALVPTKIRVPCSKPIGPIGEFMNGIGWYVSKETSPEIQVRFEIQKTKNKELDRLYLRFVSCIHPQQNLSVSSCFVFPRTHRRPIPPLEKKKETPGCRTASSKLFPRCS